MMPVMRRLITGLAAVAVLSIASPAWAAYHLMKITEVFPGTNGAPNAQYIELQMYTGGQNIVGGHTVTVYIAQGTAIQTFTFAGNVGNGASQATILIATAQAATLFGVTADLTMAPVIPLAGGKVCFETIDCVAWGNYTGAPAGVGVPARQKLGLVVGRAIARRLDISGGATILDGTDDSDQSASDFATALPTPRTNAGVNGTPPGSTCGNNAIEGLESCDDNNTMSNDGCSATCVTEACGDGIVQTSEQCDDTNSNDTDSCSNACMMQMAQPDAPPDAAVPVDSPPSGPDAGNPATGDGGGCCQTGGPGAAPCLALLVLGLLLRRRGST
jgi:cysteine-rich repeat protein